MYVHMYLGDIAALVLSDCLHACPEHHQILVDVSSLFKSIAMAISTRGALRAGQIDQRQL